MRSRFLIPAAQPTILWIALTASLLWLFYPGLIASQIPAFRDTYHFYYPQAVWLDRCAQQGNLFPSWNPDEGLGVSMAGQPSAALYYPLRPLWWLPGLSVARKLSLYIVIHLLLAAYGMRWAALRLGVSHESAWLAGICYALSCPVFFQHSNLIYLGSAAWIGFALVACFDVLRRSNFAGYVRSSLLLAIATSMMLLAGDPQSAVNTFLVAGLIFLVTGVQQVFAARRTGEFDAPVDHSPGENRSTTTTTPLLKVGFSHWGWLTLALCLCSLFSIVQWLPALRWSAHSSRRSVAAYEATSLPPLAHDQVPHMPAVEAVLSENDLGPGKRFDFSLSPWHLITCIWPTAGGHYLPSNSRSFAVIPAEGRMWIPSLYFGCWPCMLLLIGLKTKRQPLTRTLMAVAAFSVLAALGSYSVIWLLREALNGMGFSTVVERLPQDHVVSLVALLNRCIPGYAMFRYPAKWSVWFVAMVSLLAALHLDRIESGSQFRFPRRLRQLLLRTSWAGIALAVGLWFSKEAGFDIDTWLAQNAADPWLGAPDSRSMALSIGFACIVPSVVLGLSSAKLTMDWFHRMSNGRQAGCIVLVTLAEMTVCASCWIQFIPAPAPHLDELHRNVQGRPSHRPLHSSQPFVWVDLSEANLQRDQFTHVYPRFIEAQAKYQQTWLLGKLALLSNLRCFQAAQSVEPRELTLLRWWLSRHDRMRAVQPAVDEVLGELGITHRLIRTDSGLSPSEPGAQFAWQPVDHPQHLCQLFSMRGEPAGDTDPVNWQWQGTDRLKIEFAAPLSDSRLLVRQTNDGGWTAFNQAGQPRVIAEHPWLLEISLSATDTRIDLKRKWLW